MSDLTDLVETRIYPDANTSGTVTFPYIVFGQDSSNHEHHQGGAAGLTEGRWEFNIFADTPLSAEAAGTELREALDGFQRADMGDDDLDVRSVHLQTEDTVYIPGQQDKKDGAFNKRMDFMIWHAETVPTF